MSSSKRSLVLPAILGVVCVVLSAVSGYFSTTQTGFYQTALIGLAVLFIVMAVVDVGVIVKSAKKSDGDGAKAKSGAKAKAKPAAKSPAKKSAKNSPAPKRGAIAATTADDEDTTPSGAANVFTMDGPLADDEVEGAAAPAGGDGFFFAMGQSDTASSYDDTASFGGHDDEQAGNPFAFGAADEASEVAADETESFDFMSQPAPAVQKPVAKPSSAAPVKPSAAPVKSNVTKPAAPAKVAPAKASPAVVNPAAVKPAAVAKKAPSTSRAPALQSTDTQHTGKVAPLAAAKHASGVKPVQAKSPISASPVAASPRPAPKPASAAPRPVAAAPRPAGKAPRPAVVKPATAPASVPVDRKPRTVQPKTGTDNV